MGWTFVFIDTEHIALDRAELSWMCQTYAALVMGFSAGGHLAARVTHATAESTPPDFVVLMYPAYLTNPILEPKADPALEQENMSPAKTPPTLITVVRPDKFTVGCVNYLAGLREAKVPAELHVFSSGGHGGCFDRYPLLGWGYEAVRFLRDHQVLDDQAATVGEAWLKDREDLDAGVHLNATYGMPLTADLRPSSGARPDDSMGSSRWR